MANELLIQINADAKNAEKAFDDVKKQTEDLEGQLNKVATIGAVAFAAFTAEIFFSVKAFEEGQKSAVELTTALQNQGLYTAKLTEEYKSYADAVKAATGIDDDAVTKAQAVAQTYLGHTKITKELTFAIADLGAQMGGDLNSAAEKISRTIGTGTNAFARQGLVLDETATKAERMAKVLEFVNTHAGGLAAEFNKADGYTRALGTAFDDLQKAIGAQFAPIVAKVRQDLVEFFNYLTENPTIVKFAATFIAAGAAMAGTIAVIAALSTAFLSLSAAAAALGIALNIALIGIPLAIGAVAAAVAVLALNWDKAMAGIKAASAAAVTLLTELFGGLGKIIQGAFEFDPKKLNEGLEQVKGSFKKTADVAKETYAEITASQVKEATVQDENKKAAAAKIEAKEKQHQANLRAIRAAEMDLLKLQNENASQQLIDLKTKEIEVLKALDQEKSEAELALIRQRRDIIKAQEDEAFAEDLERDAAFQQVRSDNKAQLEQQGINANAQLTLQKQAELKASVKTELDIDRQLQEDKFKIANDARTREMLDRKKFGETYAVINKFLNSTEVQGAKSAAGELVELQGSKSKELAAIGKAAAITQIGISAAESAMRIFSGFSTIPIIGPALGVAGAAAAIAFGAEKISMVTAAADGGILTGGIPGKDSIPVLGMPGELVVPTKNFDEVVGAVQTQREGGAGNDQMVDLLSQINQKFSNPQTNYFQGDIMADDAFVDAFIRRVSDRIQYANAQIFGVTT